MLKIENLCVDLNTCTAKDLDTTKKTLLDGLNIEIKPGQIHAIMGPNGSGKSTLSKVIAGHPDYQLTAGKIEFEGQNLLELEVDEISQLGVFLGFQYPVSIPGINNLSFIKSMVDARRKQLDLPPLDVIQLMQQVKEYMQLLTMNQELLKRELNHGFSGGEKKRNEILQLLMLNPKLAILDEIDSGLDIDALKAVANGINHYHNKDNAVLLITHYQRLLDYIKPDFIHVVHQGKVVVSGDASLAAKLEAKGYNWVLEK